MLPPDSNELETSKSTIWESWKSIETTKISNYKSFKITIPYIYLCYFLHHLNNVK